MNIMTEVSNWVVPVLLCGIVFYGLYKKVEVYESFLEGAKEGFEIAINLIPTMVGLLLGVGVLRSSGFFDFLAKIMHPLAKMLMIPQEIIPLMVIKMFSSSAATGLVLDLFQTYGPDSYIGMLVSILMSCTETVFYTMSVYFMAAKVKKTGYTLPGAMIATLAGTLVSIWLNQALAAH